MKFCAVFATIIGICATFVAATSVQLPCCPNPPVPGDRLPCRQCGPTAPVLPCCENFHILPGMGHGPVCRKCGPTDPALACCEDLHIPPGMGPGPVCRQCNIPTDPIPPIACLI